MLETKERIEVCTVEDIGLVITGKDAPKVIAAINDYLSVFAKPVERESKSGMVGKYSCLNCDEWLDGFLGHFRWGIAHGEGECSCGWPCRAYHRPTLDGEELFEQGLQIILQYHPEHVLKRDR